MEADSQEVTGKRGGVRTGVSVARDQGKDAEGAAQLGLAEGGGFGLAKHAQFAGAAFDDGAGDFVRKRGGFGAGTFRKREDVEIGEGQAIDKGHRRGVVVLRFAWEARNDVGADGGVGEALADEFDAAGVVFGAVPAVHRSENTIGA